MKIGERTSATIRRAEQEWPAVVVAGAYQTGVVLMRDLRRRGVRVEAIDFNPEQPGFKTVYGKCHLCPNPDTDPGAWVAFMRELSAKIGGKPVIIPSADQFVSAIAEHADALRDHYRFHGEGVAVQGSLATKERQYEIAAKNGFPTPRTTLVTSLSELEFLIPTLDFPCLIKPVHFREWQRFRRGHPLLNEKVVICASERAVRENYALAAEVNSSVVVQQIIHGPDHAKLVYLGCFSSDGRVMGSCLLRQLRTAPIHFGSASVVEPEEDDQLLGQCDRFLESVHYVGICELELKRDTADGVVRLVEINPRYSVTADAGRYAGIELGWLHYLDLIGTPSERIEPRKRNFRHIVLQRDFACLPSYRKEGKVTLLDVARSYRPPVYFFDFDPRDWRVTVDVVIVLAKTILVRILRRVGLYRK